MKHARIFVRLMQGVRLIWVRLIQVALYCYLFSVLSCVFYLIGRVCSHDIRLGQNLLYVFLHCYHGESLYCTVLLFKNCPRLFLILSSLFNQVVMTIIVAFIIEAFLFRIQYRREHPNDENGTFFTVTV